MHKVNVAVPVVACLGILILVSSPGASAVERTSGDFYTYSLETRLMGFQVSGEIKYTFEGTDSISVAGEQYEVNIMGISGELSGGVLMIDLVTANLGGTAYEVRDGIAQARLDLSFFVNSSFGTGQFALFQTLVMEISSTYSPPVLSRFDPYSTPLGEEWTETVQIGMTNSTRINGVLWGDPVTSNMTLNYSVAVASATEMVSTDAGEFECVRIDATNDSGDSLVYWYSSKVGNFVQVHTYSPDAEAPREIVTLRDYRHEEPINLMVIVTVGAVVLIAAIAFLAYVLIRMRRRPPEPDVGKTPPEPQEPWDRI